MEVQVCRCSRKSFLCFFSNSVQHGTLEQAAKHSVFKTCVLKKTQNVCLYNWAIPVAGEPRKDMTCVHLKNIDLGHDGPMGHDPALRFVCNPQQFQ
uniref:Uncharacterized protein n=1 Tax=Sphaerodactylus townsendi TaxID=933632 RepID=A0ACB8FGE7_9SAUR